MTYRVELSAEGNDDLRKIYEYIAFGLGISDSAKAQIRRLEERIYALETMPERHRRYEKEPWRTRGLRLMPVDNYVVFYIPNDERRVVNVVRIIYGGQNIAAQLEQYMENC